MLFKDLNLHQKLLIAIKKAGYKTPTPVQEKAIPKIFSGSDLQVSAQTGTGKTAAFLLPVLTKMMLPSELKGKGPRVLILVPTRELAMQVTTEANKYSSELTKKRAVCIYGGVPYQKQKRSLSKPYDILVATPGRLIDLIKQRCVNLSMVETFILDEADRMLDMGFISDVEDIASKTNKSRQTLLFSATLKKSVLNLSKKLLKDPEQISITPQHEKHENIEQRLHYVDNLNHKNQLLDHLLNDKTINNAIIFTSTKSFADQLVDRLYEDGHQVEALHGDMNQRQRTRTIKKMREGKVKILVATDVAARGIDIQTISHVFNFDLPRNTEDYVHRIGRTGRAGADGIALSFATFKEAFLVTSIEKFTGQKIVTHTVDGMEPKSKFQTKRAPSKRRFKPNDEKRFSPRRKKTFKKRS